MTAEGKRCEESLLNPPRPSCLYHIWHFLQILYDVWFKIPQENHQREAVGFFSERSVHKLPMCNASTALQQEGKDSLSHKYDVITEQIFITKLSVQVLPQTKVTIMLRIKTNTSIQVMIFQDCWRTADFNTHAPTYYIYRQSGYSFETTLLSDTPW